MFIDAEGAMHINPADFNSAGLLHQYGGAWRSDLSTHQLGIDMRPGADFDVGVNLLTFDRRGTAVQQGEFEADLVVSRQMASGGHLSAGYGIDDEERRVGFFQVSLLF